MNIPLPVAGSEAVPTEDMDPVIQNLVDCLTKAPQVNKCFHLNLKLQSTSVHFKHAVPVIVSTKSHHN